MGRQVPSLLLRVRIQLILLSQNLLLSFVNRFNQLIYLFISFFTALVAQVSLVQAWGLLAQECYSLKSESYSLSKLWLISDFWGYFQKRLSLWCARSTSEFLVAGPRSLFAANLLLFMSEFIAGPMRSDSRSDRSEMGCKLQVSFLLLSQFSMMPSNRQLNFSNVQISLSCCEFNYFWRSISSRKLQMFFWSQAFYLRSDYIGSVQQYWKEYK